ncbi:MAG: hypothetical protein WA265_21045 [Rhodomicrobium sp.]
MHLGKITLPLEDLAKLIDCFRCRTGLYVIGAGASRPHAPLGGELDHIVVQNYADMGSYSVTLAQSHPRLVRILNAYRLFPPVDAPEYLPGVMGHLTAEQAFLIQLMRIAKVRASGRIFDGVRIFRSFRPGVVITYNVDGLLIDLPRSPHRIFDAHGSVPTFLANPIAARWLEPGIAEEIAPVFYSINIDEPERWNDILLEGKLYALERCSPDFVAIIGYTFARQADGSHNDSLSLFRFCERFSQTRGTIFVIEPFPEPLAVTLHNELKGATIVPVCASWDRLARAYVKARLLGRPDLLMSGYRRLQAEEI